MSRLAKRNPTSRNPLRQRDFAAVWVAGFVSDVGDWLLLIALPLFVYGLTGSALQTSQVFLAELLPAVLIGSFSGVLVDRWDHRTTLVATNLVQAGCLAPLLAVDHDRIVLVYVTAAVQACLASVFNPAKQALLPRLVSAEQLGQANVLVGLNENLARLIGSPLGGLALAGIGLRGVVIADAATYLASAALVAVTKPPAKQGKTSPLGEAWREGFTVVRRTRPLPVAFVILMISQLAQGMFSVLFVVFVLRALDGGNAEVGLLRGVQAIGGVLGGLALSRISRRASNKQLVGWGFLVFGALSLVIWNSSHVTAQPGWYVALFILAGAPGLATLSGLLTEVQQVTPRDALGRVLGLFGLASSGAQAIGILVAGIAADHVSVVKLLDLQAALYLGCGLVARGLTRARTEQHDRASVRKLTEVPMATQTDSQPSAEKDPSEWVTGDQPMTGPQRSYLHTLAQEAHEEVSDDLTKAEASEKIDELQGETGRGV